MKFTKLHTAVLTALAASGSLYAEEISKKEKATIEVIQVTATKRAESIQEVPVTVTALTGDSLETLGVSNLDQYVEFLPNVVFQGTGPGQNEIYIRGAATTQTSIAVSSVQAQTAWLYRPGHHVEHEHHRRLRRAGRVGQALGTARPGA